MLGLQTPFGTPLVTDASTKQIFGVCIGVALLSFGLILTFGMKCESCMVFGLALIIIAFTVLSITLVYTILKACQREDDPLPTRTSTDDGLGPMSVDDIVVDI